MTARRKRGASAAVRPDLQSLPFAEPQAASARVAQLALGVRIAASLLTLDGPRLRHMLRAEAGIGAYVAGALSDCAAAFDDLRPVVAYAAAWVERARAAEVADEAQAVRRARDDAQFQAMLRTAGAGK